jgi:hypothetical protein
MTDAKIIQKLAGKTLYHDMCADGRHRITFVWFGGWNKSTACDHDYQVALRVAAVGTVPLLSEAERQRRVAALLPRSKRQAYLASR